MADRIAVERVVPCQLAADLLGVGIDEKLVVVEPMSLLRRVGTVNPVAIFLARPQTRVACWEKTAKFTPSPSNFAPSGDGRPADSLKRFMPSTFDKLRVEFCVVSSRNIPPDGLVHGIALHLLPH